MTKAAADRLFVEPGLDWRPVSPKLLTERRLPVLVGAIVGVGLIVVALLARSAGASGASLALGIPGLVIALVAAGLWIVVLPRIVSSWRYAEREQDLLVSHGRLNRHLAVVPYGRMQVIEVTANPVSSHLGIATITLVTASAKTDARIPGLPVDAAHQLRDRLASKGEALSAGL
ncbi:MAG: PH domain-containing protein [Nocardioidaceae bacterium]